MSENQQSSKPEDERDSPETRAAEQQGSKPLETSSMDTSEPQTSDKPKRAIGRPNFGTEVTGKRGVFQSPVNASPDRLEEEIAKGRTKPEDEGKPTT